MAQNIDSQGYEPSAKVPRSRFVVFGVLCAFLTCIAGALSPIVAGAFQFIVSPEWRNALLVPSSVVLTTTLIFALWFLMRVSKIDSGSGRRPISPKAEGAAVAVVLLSSLIWLFAVYTIPMAATFVFTSPLTLFLTVAKVEDPKSFQDGKCPNEVTFVETNSIFWNLCHLPSELVEQLYPGQRVELKGTGTWMGMWVQEAKTGL